MIAKRFRNAGDWDAKHSTEPTTVVTKKDPSKHKHLALEPLLLRPLNLSHLKRVLAVDGLAIQECLDPSDIRALFDREVGEAMLRFTDWPAESSVFRQPLGRSTAMHHAVIQLGQKDYQIPSTVYASVEQLYHTGINQPHLFHTRPSHDRLHHLITIFDRPYTTSSRAFFAKGFDVCLKAESTPNLCALLMTFLELLPAPIVDPVFTEAFWEWCIYPTLRREERRTRGEGVPSHNSLHPNVSHIGDYALETRQIATARALLRLLPRAGFSLFVYLMNFFSQTLLYSDNRCTTIGIADMFTRPLFGCANAKCKRATVWFMTRWHRVLNGLFDESNPSAEDLFASCSHEARKVPQPRHTRRRTRPTPPVCPPPSVPLPPTPTPVNSTSASTNTSSSPCYRPSQPVLSPQPLAHIAHSAEFERSCLPRFQLEDPPVPHSPSTLPTPCLSFASTASSSSEERASFVAARDQFGIDRIVFRGVDVMDDLEEGEYVIDEARFLKQAEKHRDEFCGKSYTHMREHSLLDESSLDDEELPQPNDRLFEMLFEACRSDNSSDSYSQQLSGTDKENEGRPLYSAGSIDVQREREQAMALYEWGASLECNLTEVCQENGRLLMKVEGLERERDAALELVRQMRAMRI